jgi:hypothetical protein
MNNGITPFSQIPQIGQREAQAKAMIAQQVGQLTREIFVRAAALRMQHPGAPAPDFEELARQSHAAAKAYFQGLGVAQFDQKEQPTQ